MADPNTVFYDETGMFTMLEAWERARKGRSDHREIGQDTPTNSLPLEDLNGSWYLQLVPEGPHPFVEIRGPLRIEVAPPRLLLSGDVYVNSIPPPPDVPFEVLSPVSPAPLIIGTNWYPQLPFEQYSWYLRSTSAIYANGELTVTFTRRVWDQTIIGLQPHEREFLPEDNQTGVLVLKCPATSRFSHPKLPNSSTLRVTGTMQIGEARYSVAATKTSPYHRGCAVVVDIMEDRTFPLDVTTCQGAALDYVRIFREEASMDIGLTIHETRLPEVRELTIVGLNQALATNRQPAPGTENQWLLWLFIGSQMGGILGMMFDFSPPFRQGVAGFWDKHFEKDARLLASSQGQKAGKVPLAFLRTLIHETGHAFNLLHPKDDIHTVPVGVTLMNQTSDVIGFAAEPNLFPCCAAFHFEEHNRHSLIHSPDPQIAPGWKRLSWGHDSLFSGVHEAADAVGVVEPLPEPEDLELELDVPTDLFRGEYIIARCILRNISNSVKKISVSLNLALGDLKLVLTPPGNLGITDARDVIVGCGERDVLELEPSDSIEWAGQIFYTNIGHTFRHVGRYYISARLHYGDKTTTTIRSPTRVIIIRAPLNVKEQEIARLTIDGPGGIGVGKAFALGDFGLDEETKRRLERLATEFGNTRTGQAAAFVLANALHRPVNSLQIDQPEIRPAEPEKGLEYFRRSIESLASDPEEIAVLASGTPSPLEGAAPILELAQEYLASSRSAAEEVRDAILPEASPENWEAIARTPRAYARAETVLDKLRRSFPGYRNR